MNKTNLFISEGITTPLDEGGTKLCLNFINNTKGEKVLVNKSSRKLIIKGVSVINVYKPKIKIFSYIFYPYFILKTILIIKKLKPNKIFYFPLRYPNLLQQIFCYLISKTNKNFNEVLFQTKDNFGHFFYLISKFKIIVISNYSFNYFKRKGMNVNYIDVNKLLNNKDYPKNYDKKYLRKKYRFLINDFIVAHVGHNTSGRGLKLIFKLAKLNKDIKFLIVLSSRHKRIPQNFRSSNIKIIKKYINNINEIYKISDIYLFPLLKKDSAIDIPLSILEAKKMDLPIIATDTGALKESLKGYKKSYIINKKNMLEEINLIINKIKNEKT